jgi:DNA-binding NtrC family response regulator
MFEKILVIDDNEDILFALKMFLRKHSKNIFIEKNPQRIPFLVSNDTYDAILLDMNFTQDTTSGKEGFLWLQKILEINPAAVVVMITAYGDVEMAVKALKLGATDFVLKPWNNEKLVETITNAVAQKKALSESPKNTVKNDASSEKKGDKNSSQNPFEYIIGKSEAIQSVFTVIKKVAVTDANVLILGENGTGKELFAKAIHDLSMRKEKTFVSVDMGSITETLFESELFGHKKGAFTDAKEDRAGRFEAADKGTIFLDEIGNLSSSLQSKLLTVLQKREVTRVGANKAVSIDIRLISATNMPLYDMVHANEFRQDLLYRLNTVEIRLPALRERIEDIPLLAEHFIKHYCQKYKIAFKPLERATLNKLQNYPWHGNIRELQHAIERAIIMSESEVLEPGDFMFLLNKAEVTELEIDDFNLENVEKIVIKKAISKHGGNISKAAKALGLTRASLYRRMEKFGL